MSSLAYVNYTGSCTALCKVNCIYQHIRVSQYHLSSGNKAKKQNQNQPRRKPSPFKPVSHKRHVTEVLISFSAAAKLSQRI